MPRHLTAILVVLLVAPAALAQLRPLATVHSIADLRAWLRSNGRLGTDH